MSGAYYEKIARINLTTGEIKVEKLDVELAENLSKLSIKIMQGKIDSDAVFSEIKDKNLAALAYLIPLLFFFCGFL